MKLEVGKTYKNRKGELVVIVHKDSNHTYSMQGNNNRTYTESGAFRIPTGTMDDLIEEITEENPMTTTDRKFKVGDKVYSILSGIGTVTSIDDWQLIIKTIKGYEYAKTNGKDSEYDINPIILTLDEARAKGYDVPKEKVKKTRIQFVNVYPDGVSGLYLSLEYAKESSRSDVIATVPVTIEWEEAWTSQNSKI